MGRASFDLGGLETAALRAACAGIFEPSRDLGGRRLSLRPNNFAIRMTCRISRNVPELRRFYAITGADDPHEPAILIGMKKLTEKFSRKLLSVSRYAGPAQHAEAIAKA